PQSGSLHITSTPAAGASVAPGSSISFNASWNSADFNETDRMYLCGTVDGTFNSAMSSQDKGVGNTGSWSGTATIPADAPAGSNVCVVTALVGQLPTKVQGQTV